MKVIGPFTQILSLTGLPDKGPIEDTAMQIITNGGIIIADSLIIEVGNFEKLRKDYPSGVVEEITEDLVLLPGFIDCHTHICYAGSRATDYAMRISGKSYLEIAQSGGGIWDTVTQTRSATEDELVQLITKRALLHLQQGVTTIEVKSGYGLSIKEELKQLRAIKIANGQTQADLIPTCLAAHMKPKDFEGTSIEYLNTIQKGLWPVLKAENLTDRLDIFIEKSAFTTQQGQFYLNNAIKEGFKFTIHADQFTSGGSKVAVNCKALSADHLESSTAEDIKRLADSETIAVVLPGASLGLGLNYAPARRLLDAGGSLAIASDWNPGSAPMGNLLLQAAVMGASEKLSNAETFAGLTYRAARALNLNDRGSLRAGGLADFQAFNAKDYRDILYYQGSLKPVMVWKNGNILYK
jgi:imidazolonepropionase